MLKSFIGADMRLYERFGVGLHNIPDFKESELAFDSERFRAVVQLGQVGYEVLHIDLKQSIIERHSVRCSSYGCKYRK